MATSSPAAKLSPERIFTSLTAYQQTAAMKAAIETGVFTAIGEGAQQPAELAKKTGAAERGVRILCDYLVVHGFLTKANGKYALTQESAVFLDRKSPAYIGSMTGFLLGETHRKCYESLTEAVRKGGTAEATGDHTQAHEKVWVEFARSMANMTGPSAGFIAQ